MVNTYEKQQLERCSINICLQFSYSLSIDANGKTFMLKNVLLSIKEALKWDF